MLAMDSLLLTRPANVRGDCDAIKPVYIESPIASCILAREPSILVAQRPGG